VNIWFMKVQIRYELKGWFGDCKFYLSAGLIRHLGLEGKHLGWCNQEG
jgi:hypothetical protein